MHPFRAAGRGVMLAVMKLAVPIVVPPRALGGATDAGIEAIARIKALVVIDQFRFCVVQMAEVVLSRELRAALVRFQKQSKLVNTHTRYKSAACPKNRL